MSVITSNFTSYRSKNLGEEFFKIIEEDYNWVCSSLNNRGFMFFIAFISLMSLSILKAIATIIDELKKPVMTYDHLNIRRGMRSDNITSILRHRELVSEVKNHDHYCPDDQLKAQRTHSITSLRTYLYKHDLTLHVNTLKKTNHKVSEKDLMEMYRTGEISKPISTTKVTFGDDLNKLLKEVLGNVIDLKINKVTKETYIQILNDDFFPLKNALKDLYNEKVTLKFD